MKGSGIRMLRAGSIQLPDPFTPDPFIPRSRDARYRRLLSTFIPPLQLNEHIFDALQPKLPFDFLLRPDRNQVAAGEEGETSAARRLVHVVRRDENRRARLRERV